MLYMYTIQIKIFELNEFRSNIVNNCICTIYMYLLNSNFN